ncbi:SpaA isopeptide-forming pilin-related protein, partial [Clostridium sp.]|uniref:SpaA isopeptide-forming pilin-related protein n=1 Tax=Clostridium sp. TaxID=1506 RepID=UPI00399489D0
MKKKIAFMLATIVGTNILWQNIVLSNPKMEVKVLQSLGDYKTYNGVVFGKHTASGADVEGKLAVKGDIEAPTIGNSFSIAAAFNGNNVAVGNPIIDTTTPTFLLGGEIIDTGTTTEGVKRNLLLSAGIGVLTSKANKDLLKPADKFEDIIEKSEKEIYDVFNKIQNDINASIEKAKAIESSDEKVNGSTLKFARAKANKNILINEEWRNEKHLDFKGIDSWEFRIPKLEENDHLIMYSEAETINFDRVLYYEGKEIGTYDKALMHKLASKILWVFPNAKTIETLRVDVPGSIIAPKATINIHGGSINGQVFTNNLNQVEKDTAKNGELHNFIFNWDILSDLGVAKGSLEIKKVDSENKDLVLSGAEFVIKDAEGKEVAKGVTDEKGIAKFENLVAGRYTYQEIKAPEGYELNREPVEFEITTQGQVVTKVVENKKIIIKGSLEIKKVDSENKDLVLPGAEFVIKDAKGIEVAKGTTDEKGLAKFENLVAGRYTYQEIKAPEGYELKGNPVEFEITTQGQVVTKVVENKKIIIKGSLEIKKVDSENKDLVL